MAGDSTSHSPALERTIVWAPVWDPQRAGQGIEHLLLTANAASSIILGFDEDGQPYRLGYTLALDERWRLQTAQLAVMTAQSSSTLHLDADESGNWHDKHGERLPTLAGCRDLDLWPTPFTNTLAIRRFSLAIHERRELSVVYVAAPALRVTVMQQAYTRLDELLYRYESLESGYQVELPVDADGVVRDYPGLFRRLY